MSGSGSLAANVPGRYFVHRDCVDCDTCRAIAPEHFTRREPQGQAYVFRQPRAAEEVARVEEALDCCPVVAIRRRADGAGGTAEGDRAREK